MVRAGIEGAVPAIREWKHARLPRAIADADVARVLAAVDQTRPNGLRDRAILLLLSRLGLRAAETAALTVKDVDWHNGAVRVAGKGGRERELPLPADVGAALVAALRSRPPTSPPDVIFVTARPPYRQLSGSTVSDIAKRALRRAGVTVPRPGAHVFRHAFASQMVRRDVPMKTVADLLGHARLETTTIYAKLDRETLATNRPAVARRCTMTGEAWRQHLQTYLALRRAIGFTMQREAHLLQDFVEHLERRGDDAPVAQVAVEWASASTESQHARRLSIVRAFLTMVRAAEPDVDVPGAGLVRTSKRPTPRILAPHEVLALMEAARSLGPRDALRPHTVATVIGLLASCGLRAGEAIHLDIDDVDLVSALPCLQIQRTKFRKSRLVPLHPTTAAALQAYAKQRRVLGYGGFCSAFYADLRIMPMSAQTPPLQAASARRWST